jgi:hypothetical protein
VSTIEHKPFLSISISPEQRDAFYAALTKLRQRQPFVTKSALVVQAVIDAAQYADQEYKETRPCRTK